LYESWILNWKFNIYDTEWNIIDDINISEKEMDWVFDILGKDSLKDVSQD